MFVLSNMKYGKQFGTIYIGNKIEFIYLESNLESNLEAKMYGTYNLDTRKVRINKFKKLDNTIDREYKSKSYFYLYYSVLFLMVMFLIYATIYVHEQHICTDIVKANNITFNCENNQNTIKCYNNLKNNLDKYKNGNYSC